MQEVADWWLAHVARHQVRASSLDAYRKEIGYLVADLGAIAVRDVGPETVTEWQAGLLDRFAPYSVLNCRKVGRQVFTEALKVGLITKNPFDLVKSPRAHPIEGRALSVEEARKLVGEAEHVRLGAAVTLLFCQGWRVSEVLGLAWDDLDLLEGRLRPNRRPPSLHAERRAPT